MRIACLGSTLSVGLLLRGGAELPRHAFSEPGSHDPGLPVAFSVTFVLQIHLWHLGVSPTACPPRADSVSDSGFHGDLATLAMPLWGQVFAVPGCSSAIAKGPLSLGLSCRWHPSIVSPYGSRCVTPRFYLSEHPTASGAGRSL